MTAAAPPPSRSSDAARICASSPKAKQIYDAGYSYASLTHFDEGGRPLIYSWIREGRSVDLQRAARWSGVQAIPRVLSLDAQNRLCSEPVPELEALRGAHYSYSAADLDDGILPLRGLALDIEAEFDPSQAETCGIELARSPDGREKAAITYDAGTEALRVTRQYASETAAIDSQAQGLAHRLDAGENLKLRILLDGSVIEVIANGRTRVASRFYPSSADCDAIRVFGRSGLRALDLWEMASI